MRNDAKNEAKVGREANALLTGAKLGQWDIPKEQLAHARNMRRTSSRVVGLKGTGALGAATAGMAGGAGAYELGRHHLKRRKKP